MAKKWISQGVPTNDTIKFTCWPPSLYNIVSDHHSDKKWIGPTPHHEPLNPVFLVFKSELEVLSGLSLSVEKCWQNSIHRIVVQVSKLDCKTREAIS